jgi:hypothetical protein
MAASFGEFEELDQRSHAAGALDVPKGNCGTCFLIRHDL